MCNFRKFPAKKASTRPPEWCGRLVSVGDGTQGVDVLRRLPHFS